MYRSTIIPSINKLYKKYNEYPYKCLMLLFVLFSLWIDIIIAFCMKHFDVHFLSPWNPPKSFKLIFWNGVIFYPSFENVIPHSLGDIINPNKWGKIANMSNFNIFQANNAFAWKLKLKMNSLWKPAAQE